MNGKVKNIELKIYELLGIKVFRKMAFGLYKAIGLPFTIFMSKEARRKIYSSPSNYNMKKGHGLQDLRDFKKMLLLNTSIHIWALSLCLPHFFKVIAGTASTLATINNLIPIVINLYCIMLKRYNFIRINEVIKKGLPHEEKKKNEITDELKQADSLLAEHTYKIVHKKGKEKSIAFEELIAKANLSELKYYRKCLKYFYYFNQNVQNSDIYSDKQQVNTYIRITNHKTLKLELKTNKENKKSN